MLIDDKLSADCPVCSLSVKQLLTKKLRRGIGKVYYCSLCDHGFLFENLLKDNKIYYNKKYRQEYSHNAEKKNTNPHELFTIYSQFQRDRLEVILPKLNFQTNLLEVGASAGQFLTHIKNKVAKIHAIELDNSCCQYLKEVIGIECDSEYLEDSKFAEEQYDIICAFQVMEHVTNPVEFIRTLKKVAKPNASIFIEVPNIYDPLLSVWNILKYREFFYHEAHIHYFSENSIRKVAEAAGFKQQNIEVLFTQDYNLLNHLHWIMNDSPQNNCLIGLSEVNLNGVDTEISTWLNKEIKSLNQSYIDRLIISKKTSNMLVRLRNE